jgi:hypothetical protein
LVLYAAFFLCVLPDTIRAGSIVNSSLTLTSLTLTPTCPIGTPACALQFSTGFYTLAQAGVQNSLGESDPELDFESDITATITSTVTWATSSATATVTENSLGSGLWAPGTLASSASVNLDVPDTGGLASAGTITGYSNAQLGFLQSGSFQIDTGDAPGTDQVTVSLSALLSEAESLITSGGGVSASSEAIFTVLFYGTDTSGNMYPLLDSNGNPIPLLFYDDPLSIGPDSALSKGDDPSLNTTLTLWNDTSYSIFAETDIEASAVTASTPEPSSFMLTFSSLILCVLILMRRFTA